MNMKEKNKKIVHRGDHQVKRLDRVSPDRRTFRSDRRHCRDRFYFKGKRTFCLRRSHTVICKNGGQPGQHEDGK